MITFLSTKVLYLPLCVGEDTQRFVGPVGRLEGFTFVPLTSIKSPYLFFTVLRERKSLLIGLLMGLRAVNFKSDHLRLFNIAIQIN